jgi:hypothetical protein
MSSSGLFDRRVVNAMHDGITSHPDDDDDDDLF